MAGGTTTSKTQDPEERRIPVQFQHTSNFPDILQQLRISLVVSTYQAGKVLVLGAHQGKLAISLLDYERPMGVAVGQDKIAIGAGASIHFLRANHAVAPTVAPVGSHDGCFVPHTSRHTGKILVHDLGWGTEGLWLVNTLFSCLCTLDDNHSFIPRWKPHFISALADEDRCHLNGMAMDQGQPRYVTCLAPVDTAAGWRADKARTGCLIDVQSGEFVARGLCMPHSPRVERGELFVLNSGYGNLSRVDRASGRLEAIEQVPGYTRGLAFHGQFAFVGLSRIRETNVFGGLPIGEHREELCCGVAAIDMTTGRTVATFRKTLAKSRGNTSGNGAPLSNYQIGSDMHLELNQGPTDFDNRHNFTVSGTALIPHTGGLNLSWVARALSGRPFSLTNGNVDPDLNGIQAEPLPAGTTPVVARLAG